MDFRFVPNVHVSDNAVKTLKKSRIELADIKLYNTLMIYKTKVMTYAIDLLRMMF